MIWLNFNEYVNYHGICNTFIELWSKIKLSIYQVFTWNGDNNDPARYLKIKIAKKVIVIVVCCKINSQCYNNV